MGIGIDVFNFDHSGLNSDETKPRILTPILFVRVWPEVTQSAIRLTAILPPEVNQFWLKRRFPQRDRRRQVLDGLGVLPVVSSGTDDDVEDSGPVVVPSIDETMSKLFDLTKPRWREYPNLAQRPSSPPLENVSEDGIYNRTLLMAVPSLKYAQRLYGELHRLAYKVTDEDLDRTALANLFPHDPSADSPQPATVPSDDHSSSPQIVELTLMNEDQRTAAEAAMHEPLMVVTGPPGTGKSTVVQTALANLALTGSTGLFASRNHQGLEAVEPKLNALVDPEQIILRPVYPFEEKSKRFEWQVLMLKLLCKPQRDAILNERDSERMRLKTLLGEQAADEERALRLLKLRDRLAEANGESHRLRTGMRPAIASLTETALTALPVLPMNRLARWLDWIGSIPRPVHRIVDAVGVPIIRLWAKRLISTIPDSSLHAVLNATLGGRDADALRSALVEWKVLAELVMAEQSARDAEVMIRSDTPIETIREQLSRRGEELRAGAASTLQLVAEAAGGDLSPERREEMAKLRAGLHNRGNDLSSDDPLVRDLARAFRRAMPEFIKSFPLWAVANLSISKAVPLTPALFNLAIIDEASQCDIPSAIPVLFRAQRAMIVGDPMQLAHVTQIGHEAEMNVRRRLSLHGMEVEDLTYAANSLFDVASTRRAACRIELRSHYRCDPDIAAYCNDTFYGKTLWVRTSCDGRLLGRSSVAGRTGCRWTNVEGKIIRAANGCYCPAHMESVILELEKLRDARFPGSIGVVTPFRVHADRLRDLVYQRIEQSVRSDWRFIVHTADGFQGDERDLMLFSLVGGVDMPEGSLNFLRNGPNRFNVAVSRARNVLHVIGDERWAASCSIPFITELLRRCRGSASKDRVIRQDLIGPVWEPRLAEALRRRGLPVEQQYPAAGYFLDIALLQGEMKLDIEVDGETYHRDPVTGERRLDDVYRDAVLRALDWQVMRFWVYELRENLDGCVKRVQQAFANVDAGERSEPATI
ncbi:MAG: DUF559 domain-containing protein [Planctomycetes bacterium]|nr:DUF559 domain-containing protein [Planctomycetota bacterium]NOG53209.1 ATP-binding protein [Planctomycetota bacterium]